MNLNALRLFVAVVQEGSLSKTSEKLDVPVATISRQISGLEKSLNIQLFDRFKSGVKPTMAGQRLYEQVYAGMDNLVNAGQVLFAEQGRLKGLLRISAPPGCTPVLDWIAEFQTQFPQVQIHCTMTDRVLDMTADGIDVAFRMGGLHGDNFIAKKVLSVGAKWVAHPDLLAKSGTPHTVAELAALPVAGWARNGGNMLKVMVGKQAHFVPYVFACNESSALEYMAVAGKAVCQLADYSANRMMAQHGLVEVLADVDFPRYDVSMIYAAHRYPSSIVRAFVEFVGQQIEAV
ncbi:LysR family transcriptional regulator [Neisseria weixii]|uniref:LysR family transcriptional regulator n=1 Tax=Neisseria weixii TaxID=1853276 RepID=UPI000BB8F6EC|nr:LysR family transcriptional regulator [Neisseria weixii]ATD65269.1 transcriptional regulator [Neisseria weixii]